LVAVPVSSNEAAPPGPRRLDIEPHLLLKLLLPIGGTL
jgi:hypothetical protein